MGLPRYGRNAEHDPLPRLVVYVVLVVLLYFRRGSCGIWFLCLCGVSCVCLVCRRAVCPCDRVFEQAESLAPRLFTSVVGSSRRDRDAERNSFPLALVVAIEPWSLASIPQPWDVIMEDLILIPRRFLPTHHESFVTSSGGR